MIARCIIIPTHILLSFREYHAYYVKLNHRREFNETITVLLNYVIGDMHKITDGEIKSLEDFFEGDENIFNEFLRWVLITMHEQENS